MKQGKEKKRRPHYPERVRRSTKKKMEKIYRSGKGRPLSALVQGRKHGLQFGHWRFKKLERKSASTAAKKRAVCLKGEGTHPKWRRIMSGVWYGTSITGARKGGKMKGVL